MLTQFHKDNAEFDRVAKLTSLDLNYGELQESLKDLAKLAATIAGTSISLVNLIDAYTQWSVGGYGFENGSTPREDSVCQYTIGEKDSFEVRDLKADERFRYKDYVVGEPDLTYYFGVPLTTSDGYAIGALCVLDNTVPTLDAEKVNLLKMIAKQIVERITDHREIERLNQRLTERVENEKRLAHDIRGPIAGIVGLARLYKDKSNESSGQKLSQVFTMIETGGQSLIHFAEDILDRYKKDMHQKKAIQKFSYTLFSLKEAIQSLYQPMAVHKNIALVVTATGSTTAVFKKEKLLQIMGNLVSNAIKFTPDGGKVDISLAYTEQLEKPVLHLSVQDTGAGFSSEMAANIFGYKPGGNIGTAGESGYGLGLSLVHSLVVDLGGSITASSGIDGARFDVFLPQKVDAFISESGMLNRVNEHSFELLQ